MNFEIDPTSLCQVTVRTQYSMYSRIKQEDLTPEQVFKIIKGEDICTTTSRDDHPEFKELRNTLEDQGFIKTERSWWNGDRVLKSFTLNGAKFRKDEKFHCGAAIEYTVKQKQKNKRYKSI
jgi:GTP1/Obg family GTP-binding protein